MKKRLLVAIPTAVLALGLAIGGSTYALFTSSASNTGNIIGSAVINLTQERDQGDTVPGPMFYTGSSDPTGKLPYNIDTEYPANQPPGGESLGGLAPGDSVTRAMNLMNDDFNGKKAIDAKITRIKATVNSLGLTSGQAYDEFISKLNVKVAAPALNNKTLYDGPLSGLLNGTNEGWVDLPANSIMVLRANGGDYNITFTVTLDKTADNLIQDKTFVFDFSFYAEQARNNP